MLLFVYGCQNVLLFNGMRSECSGRSHVAHRDSAQKRKTSQPHWNLTPATLPMTFVDGLGTACRTFRRLDRKTTSAMDLKQVCQTAYESLTECLTKKRFAI